MSGTTVCVAILLAVLTEIQVASTFSSNDTCTICACEQFENNLYINCSFRNLTSIPPVPSRAVLLNMSHTQLSAIQGSPLLNATSLKVLDLSNSGLKNISSCYGLFKGLTNLTHLNISYNEYLPLTNITVHQTLFQDLRKLEVLNMYGTTSPNQFGTYPDEALAKLISLRELWMDGMTNRSLGPGFNKMTNLRVLRLPGDLDLKERCETDIIRGMFDNVVTVTHLYIRHCGVKRIEKDALGSLFNLHTLDLSYNNDLGLEEASLAFESLQRTNISILMLNNIYPTSSMVCGVLITNTILRRMSNLNLTELHLEHNNIVSVEHNAMKLLPATLEVIDVSNNEFRLQPYVLYVSQMQNLKWLDLSYQFFPNLLLFKETKDKLVNNELSSSNTVGYCNKCKDCGKAMASNGTDKRSNASFISHRREDVNLKIEQSKPSIAPEFRLGNNTMEYINFELESQHQQLHNIASVCPKLPAKLLPVTPTLPKNLEYLDISHSKLTHPIFKFRVDPDNVLRHINASNSMLYCWDGPVYGLAKLEYLDLSNNLCTRVRIGFFDELGNIKVLLIQMNLLGFDIENDVNGQLLRNLSKLELLDISLNRVRIIPNMFLKSQASLRILNASCNIMTEFDLRVSHMKNLSILDLSKNSISTIPTDLTHTIEAIAIDHFQSHGTPFILNLTRNNIMCNCKNIDFLKWVFKHQTNYINVIISDCEFDNQTRVIISDNRHLRDIIAYLEKQCASHGPLIVGLMVALMFIINITVGILVYRYRWKIRYWYYVAGRRIGTRRIRQRNGYVSLDSTYLYEQRNSFKYDAYVASAEADRDFVMENMKHHLEENVSSRLCIPERDFVPGQSVYRMIGNAINVSRVTIFVTSRKSLEDREWEIAMRMAQEEALKRGRKIYFAIFIEEIPKNVLHNRKWIDINDIFKTRSYIDYPAQTEDESAKEMFWQDCKGSSPNQASKTHINETLCLLDLMITL